MVQPTVAMHYRQPHSSNLQHLGRKTTLKKINLKLEPILNKVKELRQEFIQCVTY